MSNIIYVKDDLFNAPKDAYLGHAVNCKGVWASGIAKQFVEKFPKAFSEYKMVCYTLKRDSLPGLTLLCSKENEYKIICLFTSLDYGFRVDTPELILEHTKECCHDIMNHSVIREIHIPKINSGLFKVPWEQTEAVLKMFPEITFYVYEK